MRCDYCGKEVVGHGISSTQGTYCSHTCNLAAVADAFAPYAHFREYGTRPRKRVVSRVVKELEQGNGEKAEVKVSPSS